MLGQCGATANIRRKSSGPSEEDVMRMKQMVRFLGDVYSMEEQSQAKVDSDLLAKLDEYLLSLQSGPNSVIAELESHVGSMEQENMELRRQINELSPCHQCKARDQRRRERGDGNGWSPKDIEGSRRSHRQDKK
jgi:hypothetical protein